MTEFDAVGTYTPADWAEWELTNAAIDERHGGLVLADGRTYREAATIPGDGHHRLDVVDVDVDECGVPYLLDASGDLYRYDHERDTLSRLACVWQPPGLGPDEAGEPDREGSGVGEPSPDEAASARRPVALCVTADDVFVADVATDGADPGDGRVHALSKHLLATRWVAESTHSNVDVPVRLVDDGTDAYLLDTGAGDENDGGDEAPATGYLARLEHEGVGERIVDGLVAPRDVAVALDGTLYVLAAGIEAYGPDGSPAEGGASADAVASALPGPAEPASLAATGTGELVVGLTGGDGERTLIRYEPASGTFERLSDYRRGVGRLRARPRRPTGLYAVGETDEGRGVVRFLASARLNQVNDETGRRNARARRWFDSGRRGVQWHRVRLALAANEPGTGIQLRYRATDESPGGGTDPREEWQELDAANPDDALLADAEGRYLGIELELVGTEFASPRVDRFEAFLPRQSYLRHLPSIYETDPRSSEFLERFLSVFESVFTDIEAGIEAIPTYLDPGGVPREYLAWLSGWLAAETDEAWPEGARREFLNRAPELFRMRGTPQGLRAVVRIYLRHADVAFPEWWRGTELVPPADGSGEQSEDGPGGTGAGSAPPPVYLREYASMECIDDPGPREDFGRLLACPQQFLVLVPPGLEETDKRAIRRLVEAGTPAHAVGQVVALRPWIRLGGNAYLGVNSVLPDREFVVEAGVLGADTVLGAREPDGQYGFSARLGEDTRLS